MPWYLGISNWWLDLVNLQRYRWRAASYGISLRLAQPGPELLRLLFPALALIVSATTLVLAKAEVPPLPPISLGVALAGLAAIAVAAIALLRYLGSLPRLMRVATWSDEAADRIRRDMAQGMQNAAAYEQLIDLYEPIRLAANETLGSDRGFDVVTAAGGENGNRHRYATVAMPATGHESLDHLFVGPISGRKHAHFGRIADSRQRLMRKWREMDTSERVLEDERGDNYCLAKLHVDSVEAGGALRLQVGVATYGEIVRSCDSLINEFALFAFLSSRIASRRRPLSRAEGSLRMSPGAMLRCLPWRNRVHRDAGARVRELRRPGTWLRSSKPTGDLFLSPRDRAAGLGVAVVTVDISGGYDHVYLGMRSGIVGTYPGTKHVIPAGMCNTYGTELTPRREQKPPPSGYLRTAMKCEFIEEWFAVKDFENNKRPEWQRQVEDHWQRMMSEKGVASWDEPQLTGVAFDLLNLRPEVCAVVVIKPNGGVLNWEFDAIGFEGPLANAGGIHPTEIVQSGAAALWLLERSRASAAASEGCNE